MKSLRAGTSFLVAAVTGCSLSTGFEDLTTNRYSSSQASTDPGKVDSPIPNQGTRTETERVVVASETSDAGATTTSDTGVPIMREASAPTSAIPDLFQEFLPWTGRTSPDGAWEIASFGSGPSGTIFDQANAMLTASLDGAPGGFLQLRSRARGMRGAEIQTAGAFGFGYYETRMKVSSTPGVCVSFFWSEGASVGPHKWTFEFLTNEGWIASPSTGKVHLTVHYANKDDHIFALDLPFNPSLEFHRYGFLWRKGSIDFTLDGAVVHSVDDSELALPLSGHVIMNSWTGNPNWGGGPPASDAISTYDWVKVYRDASTIP